jgi:hypothetical protein
MISEENGKEKDRTGMSELQPNEFARGKMLVFRGTPQYENISEPLKMLILTIQLNFTRLLLNWLQMSQFSSFLLL